DLESDSVEVSAVTLPLKRRSPWITSDWRAGAIQRMLTIDPAAPPAQSRPFACGSTPVASPEASSAEMMKPGGQPRGFCWRAIQISQLASS
ncbi:MAG: hypothetical protein ACK53L_29815, partial [Pirellulaceae bacterium]